MRRILVYKIVVCSGSHVPAGLLVKQCFFFLVFGRILLSKSRFTFKQFVKPDPAKQAGRVRTPLQAALEKMPPSPLESRRWADVEVRTGLFKLSGVFGTIS